MNESRDPRPVHDVAIALVYREGRWLVARRRSDTHLAGMWEFPGGKREHGETADQAALRELGEECGVQAEARHTGDATWADYADRRVRLTPVVCTWTAGEGEPLGCAECRWLAAAEIRLLNMPAANAGLVAALEHLARGYL